MATLHPANQSVERVNRYRAFESELNFIDVVFSVKLQDVEKFERLSNISVNVYDLDDNNTKIVGPLYFTSQKWDRHVNMLLICNEFE